MMKCSAKKIFSRIVAIIISVIIVFSVMPFSFATGESGTDPKTIKITQIVSENLVIDKDTVINANEAWSIAANITVTVKANLTVKGAVIVDPTSKIVTQKQHDEETGTDTVGSIIFAGGLFIKGTQCIFGYDETYSYEENEISPSVVAKSGTVVTVKTNEVAGSDGSVGSDIVIESDNKDTAPSLKINKAFRIGKNDKITIAENTEITGTTNGIMAVLGAKIYNHSTKCADIFNALKNAEVYHWVEVRDIEAKNASKYVLNNSNYSVSAPEGKHISKLTIDGSDEVSAVKENRKDIFVEKPLSVSVSFENNPDAEISVTSPKYVVKNAAFSIEVRTNRDSNKVYLDGIEYYMGDGASRTEENGSYVWKIDDLRTSETKKYTVKVEDSHFSAAETAFNVVAVDGISISATARDGENEYNFGSFTSNDVVFTLNTAGGVPNDDGTLATSVKVKKDDGQESTLTGNTFTATESGRYVFIATDAKGNHKETEPFEVKIDKIVPVAEVTLSTEDWAKEVVATVKANVGSSGVKKVYYTNNGVENEITPDENNEYKIKINTDTTSAPEYIFYVENNAGIRSEETKKEIKVDKISPTVSLSVKRENAIDSFIDIITGGLVNVNSAKYFATLTVTDNCSGLSTTDSEAIKCVILPAGETDLTKGINVSFGSVSNDGKTFTTDFRFSNLEDGEYNIYTIAKDIVGNSYEGKIAIEVDNAKKDIVFKVNNAENDWDMTVDSNGSAVTADKEDGIYYVKKDFVLTAKASNETKINSVIVSYNNLEIDKFTIANYSSETGFVFDNNIFQKINNFEELCPDGTYKFIFDTDGEESLTLTVVKDSGVPAFDLTATEKISTEVELSVSDIVNINSGLESIILYRVENLGAADEKEVEIKSENGDSAFSFSENDNVYKAVVTENANYRVKVLTKSGNSTVKDIYVGNIFKKAPVLTVAAKTSDESGLFVDDINSGVWTNKSVKIVLSVNEDNRGEVKYFYSINDGEYTELNSSEVGPFDSNVDQTIKFKAIGENGLESEAVEYCIKVDKSAPNVDLKIKEGLWNKFINWIFSRESVEVSVTANDKISETETANSGIKKISLYEVVENSKVLLQDEDGNACVKEFSSGKIKETVSFKINKNTDGIIAVAEDVAGNVSEHASEDGIVIDKTAPAISFEPDSAPVIDNSVEGIKYFNTNPTITVKVVEDNFNDKTTSISITDFDGKAHSTKDFKISKSFETGDNGSSVSKSVTILKDGNYIITVSSKDKAGNEAEAVYKFSSDTTAPIVTVSYDKTEKNTGSGNGKYFSEKTVTATVTVKELNFAPENSVITVAPGITENTGYTVSEWTVSGRDKNTYIATVKFSAEDKYTINVKPTDDLNHSTEISEKLVLDRTAPKITIKYSTNPIKAFLNKLTLGLFFAEKVDVTVSATDNVAGILTIDFSGESEAVKSSVSFNENEKDVSKSFSIDPEYRGRIKAVVTDYAKNEAETTRDDLVENAGELPDGSFDNVEVVVDTTKPVISDIKLDTNGKLRKLSGVGTEQFANSNVTAAFEVDETNFFSEDVLVEVTKVDSEENKTITTYQNGVIKENGNLLGAGEKDPYGYKWTGHKAELKFEQDGDYTVTVNYTDKTGNVADGKTVKFTVDKTGPVIREIVFDKTAGYTSEKTGISYFSEDKVVATIKIKEHNFDSEKSVITVLGESKADGMYTISEWVKDTDESNVYTATVTFTGENNYTINVNTKDYAENAAKAEKKISVDRTAPEIKIAYNTNPVKAFLNEVTLGLFFKDTVVATVSFTDNTAGLRNIRISSDLEENVSSVNKRIAEYKNELTEGTKQNEVKYSIEPQFRGTITAEATDYATNQHSTSYKDLTEIIESDKFTNVELVVDNKAPVISDINITSIGDIQTKKGVGTEQFANDNITASFTINEANFFSEDVAVTVTSEDGNGKKSTVVYKNGEITVDGSVTQTDPYNYGWSKTDSEDTYRAQLSFADEKDYTVSVSYTDKSGNKAEPKTEDFTIDRTVPVIREITFDKTAKYVSDTTGINYFSEDKVVATIKIEEHNFDAENSIITVSPADKEGKNYVISKWNRDKDNANVYVATVTFTGENNYSINVKSKDYAANVATEVNKEITLDRNGPVIEITYSGNPVKAFLNDVTLGLFFKESVDVTVSAKDAVAGVSKIEFSGELEIGNSIDTAITKSTVNFEEKKTEASKTFTIDPQYRGTIKAVVTDYATNATQSTNFDLVKNVGDLPTGNYKNVEVIVDNIAPVISVEYNAKPVFVSSETGIDYYNTEVTANVMVNEHNFNAKDSIITVNASDVNENELSEEMYVISEWKTSSENADIHVATVKFAKDANFTIGVTSKDYSGNEAQAYTKKVTVDTTAPILKVSDIKFSKTDTETTENNIDYESYQYFYNGEIAVTIDADDTTAGIKNIRFYAIDFTNNSEGEVKEITPSVASQAEKNGHMTYMFKMPANFKGNIYAQAEDYATNKSVGEAKDGYTKSKGLVVENLDMHNGIALTVENSIIPGRPANENGFYNADLPVKLCVSDKYAGINNISYTVGSADPVSVNLSGESDVTYEWSVDVVLNAVSNNNNNVPVVLSYVDNAGNPHETRTVFKVLYKMDITAPVIDISYDNNSVQNGRYFKAARKMTVSINELNFKASDVIFKMTKDGKPYNSLIPSVESWTNVGTEHRTTITFAQDGDYTFDISYTDLAGNKNKKVNYGDNAVPKSFTIDNVNPVISVSYDNRSARNGNYYSSGRIATITVHEHNFNPSASIVSVTAQTRKNGSSTALPNVSSWRKVGNDIYSATVNFSSDSFYTLDVAVKDLSGRAAQKFNKEEFIIDKTNPAVKISGVANKSANKAKDIRPIISVSDTNVNPADISIIVHGAKNGTVFLYEKGQLKKNATGDGDINFTNDSFSFKFDNILKDDIYTLSVVSTDYGGNQNKFVSVLNGRGAFVDLATNSMMFSVNRNGSTYMLSSNTKKVVDSYYVDAAPEIVVTEINADEISNYEIAVASGGNIKELSEGKDFRVEKYKPGERNTIGGETVWYENTYTIFKSYFKVDQRYDINLNSNDRATNDNSSIGRCKISFCLDTHKPSGVINVDGLNSHNSINAEEAVIRINVNDNNCDIEKCVIKVDNRQLSIVNENGVFVVYDGSTKVGKYDSYKNCFVLTINNVDNSLKSSKHKVEFLAVDKAGHKTEFEPFGFTLSTNFWILFYSNTPLFVGSIVGVVLIIAAIVIIIVMKRRKSDNVQEQF